LDTLEILDRAWRRKGGDRLPKKQPLEQLDNLTLITEENRKQYIKLGNSLWSIRKHLLKPYYDVIRVLPIIPCLKKGYTYYKNDPYFQGIIWVYSPEDADMENWKRGYKSVIDWGIKQKIFYYDPSYPKVKWKHSETRLAK